MHYEQTAYGRCRADDSGPYYLSDLSDKGGRLTKISYALSAVLMDGETGRVAVRKRSIQGTAKCQYNKGNDLYSCSGAGKGR